MNRISIKATEVLLNEKVPKNKYVFSQQMHSFLSDFYRNNRELKKHNYNSKIQPVFISDKNVFQ